MNLARDGVGSKRSITYVRFLDFLKKWWMAYKPASRGFSAVLDSSVYAFSAILDSLFFGKYCIP